MGEREHSMILAAEVEKHTRHKPHSHAALWVCVTSPSHTWVGDKKHTLIHTQTHANGSYGVKKPLNIVSFIKVHDEIIRIQRVEPVVRLELCGNVFHFEPHCITIEPNYLQLKWLCEGQNNNWQKSKVDKIRSFYRQKSKK